MDKEQTYRLLSSRKYLTKCVKRGRCLLLINYLLLKYFEGLNTLGLGTSTIKTVRYVHILYLYLYPLNKQKLSPERGWLFEFQPKT